MLQKQLNHLQLEVKHQLIPPIFSATKQEIHNQKNQQKKNQNPKKES